MILSTNNDFTNTDDEDKDYANEIKPRMSEVVKVESSRPTKPAAKMSGPVASTVQTLLQWEAKLPSQQEDDRELTMEDLLSGNTSDEEHVEFQTDDKICVTFYVPTGATVDSFCLLKNGTILDITILTHKLMWDLKAIHLTTEQSAAIPEHYHSCRMKARKRILSEAIKQNLMKGNKIERKHSFQVQLKKAVSTKEKDTFHYCYMFECSRHNTEQLYMAYFEMTIFKPKAVKSGPKQIETYVERLSTDKKVTAKSSNRGSGGANSGNNLALQKNS